MHCDGWFVSWILGLSSDANAAAELAFTRLRTGTRAAVDIAAWRILGDIVSDRTAELLFTALAAGFPRPIDRSVAGVAFTSAHKAFELVQMEDADTAALLARVLETAIDADARLAAIFAQNARFLELARNLIR
jgi:hypothetical protein